MLIKQDLQARIENIISTRLENSVTFVEVFNWLSNFGEDEVAQALDILENLEYFSIPRTVATYNDNLKGIFNAFKQKNVIFLAIGEFGKSGTAMSYFIKQTPTYSDKRFKKKKFLASSMFEIKVIIEKNNLDPNDFLLILVDDFIGTGKSTVGYFYGDKYTIGLNQFLTDNFLKPAFAILSIIVQREGANFIKNKIPGIWIAAELRAKVFVTKGSVFGYRPIMLPIRELAYKKGYSLMKNPNWSLGYDNSQALVAFSHTTPNNTLPIIWSAEKGWNPLYPRYGRDKIEKLKKFREESRYWLSIASNSGIDLFTSSGARVYTTRNIQLIMIIRLKVSKKPIPVICQMLGITLSEFTDLIDEGISRGIFDMKGQLSSKGQSLYDEVKKDILIRRNKHKRLQKGSDEIIYLPMTFRGET